MSDMGARLPQRQTFPCKCQHQAQATIRNNSMQTAKRAVNGARKFKLNLKSGVTQSKRVAFQKAIQRAILF